ncbi:hypothetical protein BC834DRAFT_876763 [Gloeopeniophorella convolvens]|nr:hypothetical protein BC834DRAFT_876763 [Gloeopeniophorella convolvens]
MPKNIPLETLSVISRHVASKKDLLRLRRVSKSFHSASTPLVFEIVIVHETKTSARNLAHIINTPGIAKYVREIRLRDYDMKRHLRRNEAYGNTPEFEQVRVILKNAFALLHQVPALKLLDLDFTVPTEIKEKMATDDNAEPSPLLSLQWDVLGSIAHNPHPLPALEILSISCWLPFAHKLYDTEPFAALVSKLRRLHLGITLNHAVDGMIQLPVPGQFWDRFWQDVVLQRMLARATKLEELVVQSSTQIGARTHLDFSKLPTFPHLTSLTLGNFVWEDSLARYGTNVPHIEDFITRHGSTLTTLALHWCKIELQDEEGETPPFRTWAAVWDNLAEKLTRLTDLDVEFDPVADDTDRWDEEDRYLWLDSDCYYVSVDEPKDSGSRDRQAFEALEVAVRNRKPKAVIGKMVGRE